VRSQPVHETFKGETAWEGTVEVFHVIGRSSARSPTPGVTSGRGGRAYIAVRGVPRAERHRRGACGRCRRDQASERGTRVTFRQFIEQSLSDFEALLRREGLEAATIEMRLHGARQFARLLLGDSPPKGDRKGEATTRRDQGDTGGHRFGGPRR
jgi:hypothetical protein